MQIMNQNTNPNPFANYEVRIFDLKPMARRVGRFLFKAMSFATTEPKASHSTHNKATEAIENSYHQFTFDFDCDGGDLPLGDYPPLTAEDLPKLQPPQNRWDSEGRYYE